MDATTNASLRKTFQDLITVLYTHCIDVIDMLSILGLLWNNDIFHRCQEFAVQKGMGSPSYPAALSIETTSTHGSERTEEVEMRTDAVDPIERWTAKRRVTLVVSILEGRYQKWSRKFEQAVTWRICYR